MKFKTEDLKLGLYDDHDDFETISNEIFDQRRWVTCHDWIFRYKDRIFSTTYEIGSTETCDTRPFEYEGDEIECDELFQVQVATTQYVTAEAREQLRTEGRLIND